MNQSSTITTTTSGETESETFLRQFIELIEEGNIKIDTGFIPDDYGNLTHQVLQITCGEYVSVSAPEPLAVPLRPATADELNATVN